MKWLGFLAALLAAGAAGCTSTIASGTSGSMGASTGNPASSSSAGASGSGSSNGGASTTGSGTTSGGRTAICSPACGPTYTCVLGPTDAPVCVCDSPAATCALADGGSYCADLQSDSANCGSCQHPCTDLESCAGAQCVCSPGTTCSDDAGAPICIDITKDDFNCGQCGFSCDDDYAIGSSCDAGACACGGVFEHICAEVPSSASPICSCAPLASACATPSFAADVYPLLAQQSGAFGCSAASCHSGEFPQAGLAFLDDGGQMDAGMAYAELLGTGKGAGSLDVPFCDAGVPPFSPSTQCACFSLVIPGNTSASLISDLVTDQVPGACASSLQGMPKDPRSGSWLPLPPCSQQLIVQWVATGARP